MKKYLLIILVTAVVAVMSDRNANAQCKGFAKKLCKVELTGYIHDGNYDAAILTEGEEAELYKTFFAGQKYRIAVCSAETLPQVEFQVVDSYKNVLFDNTKADMASTWDFSPQSSQQLKIVVKVPVGSENADYPDSGCVAIMFGFNE